MNVLLGVTGGIAAYKSAYVVSMLKKAGHDVDVVMTEGATKFVSPITFETLSNNAVSTDTFSRERPFEVEHIALAKKADIAVLAPASANTIAKLAVGIADNMLTTTFLALKCPVVIAPAMNTAMYENVATQANLKTLRERGFYIMEPASGLLACGDEGGGRMREPDEIASYIKCILAGEDYDRSKQDFEGKKVLVTAGPTREAIDPVRYITNRSSGKMGYAIAEAAKKRGADVVLISGPVEIPAPEDTFIVGVESAGDMLGAVMAYEKNVDIIVMCAAIADYTPKIVHDVKQKKTEELTIELEKTVDILSELGKKKHSYLAGFAAETHELEKYAMEKLERKNADMIVANDVSGSETGFYSSMNAVSIYKRNGDVRHIEKSDKSFIANEILNEIASDLGFVWKPDDDIGQDAEV